MRFSIFGIGVLISIIFASMKAAGVPSFAAWTWFAVFAYPIGYALLISLGLLLLLLFVAWLGSAWD